MSHFTKLDIEENGLLANGVECITQLPNRSFSFRSDRLDDCPAYKICAIVLNLNFVGYLPCKALLPSNVMRPCLHLKNLLQKLEDVTIRIH